MILDARSLDSQRKASGNRNESLLEPGGKLCAEATREVVPDHSRPPPSKQEAINTSETYNKRRQRPRFAQKMCSNTDNSNTASGLASFIPTPATFANKVKNIPNLTVRNCSPERGGTIRRFEPTRTPEEVFASFPKHTFPSRQSFRTVLPFNSVCLPSTQDEAPQTQVQQNIPIRSPPPVSPFSTGSAYKVSLAHVIDSQTFYVHDAVHRQLLGCLESEFARESMAEPEPQEVTAGAEFVVVQLAASSSHSPVKCTYRRCRVARVTGAGARAKVAAYCYDYGLTIDVTCAMLRVPHNRDSWVPPLGAKCSLYNFTPRDGVSVKTAQLVHRIIGGQEVLINVRDVIKRGLVEEYSVDMTTLDRGVSIAHALDFHGLGYLVDATKPYPATEPLLPRQTLDLALPQYPMGTAINVVVTHTISDKVYVRKLENGDALKQLTDGLALEFVQAPVAYLPTIGELLVGKVARERAPNKVRYVRTLVLKLQRRSRVRVLLPDSGERLSLNYDQLRHISDKFAGLPPAAMRCRLEGLHKKKSNLKIDQLPKLNKSALRVVVKGQSSEELLVQMTVNRGRDVISVNDAILNNTFKDIVRNIESGKLSGINARKRGKKAVTLASQVQPVATTSKPATPSPPRPARKRGKTNKDTSEQPESAESQIEASKPTGANSVRTIDVQVLCSASPDAIYVKFVHRIPFYLELRNNMYAAYNNKLCDILERDWRVGDKCCVFSEEGSEWRRAVVVEAGEDSVRLLYVDHAACGTVDKSRLMPLAPEYCDVEDAAVKCHLYGLRRTGIWAAVTNEYLAYVLKNAEKCSIKPMGEFQDGSLPVVLLVQKEVSGGALEAYVYEWRSVTADLVDEGLASRDNDNPDSDAVASFDADWRTKRTTEQYLSMHDDVIVLPPPRLPIHHALADPLSELEDSEGSEEEPDKEWLPPLPFEAITFQAIVTYVNRRGQVYLHERIHAETVELISKRLERFEWALARKRARWQAGQACTALCPIRGKYSRALIYAASEKRHLCRVFFVDYGNTDDVAFKHIHKAVEMEWIPRVAKKCSLSGVALFRRDDGYLPEASVKYLRSMLMNTRCVVQVCGAVVDTATPVLMWVDGLLVNELLVGRRLAAYTAQQITAPEPPVADS